MDNRVLKDIFKGAILSFITLFLIAGPVWVVSAIYGAKGVEDSQLAYNVSWLSVIVGYLISPIYWVWRKNRWAFYTSLLAGLFALAALFFVVLSVSCSHGACF